jgi:hypothetical protein
MFGAAFFALALATAHGTAFGHTPAPVHQSTAGTVHPHPSLRFSTGALAQVCTNASWVDPQGTSAERAFYQACARHGTTGLVDCHIGYTFKYVTVPDRNGGQYSACFRGCAPFLADIQRAEDARRNERIPMMFGGVQAVGERLIGEIAVGASGLELDASSVAASRTEAIVKELVRPGIIYRDTGAPRVHAIVGDLDDAHTLFDRLSQGGIDVTPARYQFGGRMVRLPDGTTIGFRPNAGRGTSPAVDINFRGYTDDEIKFHFTNR